MTDGEKAIWAATWTALLLRELEYIQEPGLCEAAEGAWYAVEYAREAGRAVSEGCGEDSDVYKALLEMTT